MTSYSEVPIVIVKSGKMFGSWSQSARLFALFTATVFFVYILLLLRTSYLKNEQLDQISLAAMDSEQLLRELKNLDQKLAADIERLDAMRAKMGRYPII